MSNLEVFYVYKQGKRRKKQLVWISRLRKLRGISQRELADQMQLLGLDIDKNAVQRIESGQRFVTDIELKLFSDHFEVSSDELLSP